MSAEHTIEHNYSLQRLNTFGITANAAAYVRITSQAELQAALQDPALSAMPRLILGGGSNIVLTGDFPGAVLHMATRGMADRAGSCSAACSWACEVMRT